MSTTTVTPAPGEPTFQQLEAAARHYCLLKKEDPDQLIPHKPMIGPNGPFDKTPRWQLLGTAILDQWRLDEAMRVGFATLNPSPQQSSIKINEIITS